MSDLNRTPSPPPSPIGVIESSPCASLEDREAADKTADISAAISHNASSMMDASMASTVCRRDGYSLSVHDDYIHSLFIPKGSGCDDDDDYVADTTASFLPPPDEADLNTTYVDALRSKQDEEEVFFITFCSIQHG